MCVRLSMVQGQCGTGRVSAAKAPFKEGECEEENQGGRVPLQASLCSLLLVSVASRTSLHFVPCASFFLQFLTV